MSKLDPACPAMAPSGRILASESGWEDDGGGMRHGARLGTAVDRPRLYAGLLDEADRRRRMADRIIVHGLVARRGR